MHPRPGGPKWTEAETSILYEMFAAGASHQEIADALPGRSRNAVSLQLYRMGLRRNKSRPDQPLLGFRSRAGTGVKMGDLRRELDEETQMRVLRYAAKHKLTVAGAIGAMLKAAP